LFVCFSDLGISLPRVSAKGKDLPTTRHISAVHHHDMGYHDHAVTVFLISWGQAIDHDMTFTADTKGPSRFRSNFGRPNFALPLDSPSFSFSEYFFFLPEPIDKTDPVTDTDPLCCDVPESKRNEECYPVEIPSGDPFYALFRRRCMEFVRSASSLKGECKLGKLIHRPLVTSRHFSDNWSPKRTRVRSGCFVFFFFFLRNGSINVAG
jgi:hypothetical protein